MLLTNILASNINIEYIVSKTWYTVVCIGQPAASVSIAMQCNAMHSCLTILLDETYLCLYVYMHMNLHRCLWFVSAVCNSFSVHLAHIGHCKSKSKTKQKKTERRKEKNGENQIRKSSAELTKMWDTKWNGKKRIKIYFSDNKQPVNRPTI